MSWTWSPHRTSAPWAVCLAALASCLLWGALLSMVSWAGPSRAAAQTCALLPPGEAANGRGASPEQSRTAIQTVQEILRQDGMTVLSAEAIHTRLIGQPIADCHAIDCGSEVTRALAIDFVVLVTVWAYQGEPINVVVALIDSEQPSGGEAEVEGGDIAAAAREALRIARDRWEGTRTGFLQVSTEPPGADLLLDGHSAGTTPTRRLLAAGSHTACLRMPDHISQRRQVHIEARGEAELVVTLPEGQDPPEDPCGLGRSSEEPVHVPDPVTHTETRTVPLDAVNYGVGAALIAGGLGALVVPLITLATLDQCYVDGNFQDPIAPLGCDPGTGISFEGGSAALLGLGVAAIAGGAIFMALSPITETQVVEVEGPAPGEGETGETGEGEPQGGPGQSGPGQSGPGQSGPGQSGPSQSGPSQSEPSRGGPSQLEAGFQLTPSQGLLVLRGRF